MQTKSQKKLVLTGAARFNSKPKVGITFLEENRLIYADLSPENPKAQSLARFLKGCTRLDKRLLGDFISKPDNIDILQAFIGLFDFKKVCCRFIPESLAHSNQSETGRRCYARIIRELPAARRVPTDISNSRDICFNFFCVRPRQDLFRIGHISGLNIFQTKSKVKMLYMSWLILLLCSTLISIIPK